MKIRYIILNNEEHELKGIKAGKYTVEDKSEFELATLNFCRDWLNDKSSFKISTSGSTGKPKIIELSAPLMRASAQKTLKALDLRPGATALVCLNTSYIGGMMMLARGLIGDLQMIIKEPASNPFSGIDKDCEIDFTALVPLQLQSALENQISTEILKNIKNIIVGGAPVSTSLEHQLCVFHNNIFQTYGMTETISHIALRKISGENTSQYYTVLENVAIKSDERDCLMVKSDVTNNQWIITNDIVEIIDDAHFKWMGRIDNVINSGGLKIQAEVVETEIEKIFTRNSINRRFFIYGLPDEKYGEIITLCIEGAPSELLIKNLKGAFPEYLNKYQFPKRIIFVDQFTETSTGKINRQKTMLSVE